MVWRLVCLCRATPLVPDPATCCCTSCRHLEFAKRRTAGRACVCASIMSVVTAPQVTAALGDGTSLQWPPSLMAAAVLIAARRHQV